MAYRQLKICGRSKCREICTDYGVNIVIVSITQTTGSLNNEMKYVEPCYLEPLRETKNGSRCQGFEMADSK